MDLLAGWSQYVGKAADAYPEDADAYSQEEDRISELYQRVGSDEEFNIDHMYYALEAIGRIVDTGEW